MIRTTLDKGEMETISASRVEVVGHPLQHLWSSVDQSNGGIAGGAQKPSHSAAGMAVIDMKSVAWSNGRPSAQSTHPSLIEKPRLVVGDGDPVPLHEPTLSEVLPVSLMPGSEVDPLGLLHFGAKTPLGVAGSLRDAVCGLASPAATDLHHDRAITTDGAGGCPSFFFDLGEAMGGAVDPVALDHKEILT